MVKKNKIGEKKQEKKHPEITIANTLQSSNPNKKFFLVASVDDISFFTVEDKIKGL